MNKTLIIAVLAVLLAGGSWLYLNRGDDVTTPENRTEPEVTEVNKVQTEEQETRLAFVALGPKNGIGVIDMANYKLLETLPAGSNPHGIAKAAGNIFTTATKMGPGEMMMEPDHDDGEVVDMSMMMKLGSNEVSVTDLITKK